MLGINLIKDKLGIVHLSIRMYSDSQLSTSTHKKTFMFTVHWTMHLV